MLVGIIIVTAVDVTAGLPLGTVLPAGKLIKREKCVGFQVLRVKGFWFGVSGIGLRVEGLKGTSGSATLTAPNATILGFVVEGIGLRFEGLKAPLGPRP